MNIVFFGNERLATACTTNLPILTKLKNDGHHIELIIINFPSPLQREGRGEGKSRSKNESEVVTFAKKNNIELYIFKDTKELLAKLKSVDAEVAVLAAFGKIIKQEVIDHFKFGIINLHPSLLPKYRGPTPIESAILNGDDQTGISIMALTAGMDSGPIYSQIKLKLSGYESKQELAGQLGALGAKEISKLLSLISPPLGEVPMGEGVNLPPIEQVGQPTICNLITKQDSKLNLQKTALELERQIRAYLGWPGTKTTLKLKSGQELELAITAATITPSPLQGEGWGEGKNSPLLLNTQKDYLQITKLKLSGKKEITAQDFLNGYKSQLQ